MSEFVEFVKEELKKALAEEFAKQPWWCLICGEGSNYEGERPDEYWFSPEDHVCKVKELKL